MVSILPPKTDLGTALGSALGGGLQQGLQQGFADYFQAQQQQRQFAQNAQSAGLLANHLFGPQASAQKQQLTQVLSNLPPDQQIKAVEQLATGQILNQYLQGLQQPQGQERGMPQGMQSGTEQPDIPAIGKLAPLAQQQMEKKKFAYKQLADERKIALKETEPYRKSLETQARSFDELSPVLDQMEALIASKKLTNPVIAKLADKYGLVGLLNPQSQQFQALSVGFLQNAKNIFGSRVTNYDLQTYLDKIPRLAQTDAGKKALINNFKTLGEAAKIKNAEKAKIIKENKGIPPLDLEELVNQRAAPKLDKLSEKFSKSFYSKSQSGKVLMRTASGALGEVPEDKVQEALQKGYILE